MSEDYAEKIIRQLTCFDHQASPMPRWLRANREASFAIIRRFLRQAPSPTIYHYTSAAALIPIVSNNEMWLSEATFLNDRNEIELGKKFACGRVEAAVATAEVLEVRAMLESTLALFKDRADPPVYVACFSFERDDLTQWRAYGGSTGAVAIELEHGSLMFGSTSEGILDRVIYDPEHQGWVFDKLVGAYVEAYEQDVKTPIKVERKGPPLIREEENEMVAGSLYDALWRRIVACKDPAFVAEREVRFIYTAHDFGQRGHKWFPKHPAPRFRESSGRIVPYLSSKDLDFQNMERLSPVPLLPIRSVRIGPCSEPALIEKGVRRLLDQFGHDAARITHSASPFRGR
jgi:hypothetical protein